MAVGGIDPGVTGTSDFAVCLSLVSARPDATLGRDTARPTPQEVFPLPRLLDVFIDSAFLLGRKAVFDSGRHFRCSQVETFPLSFIPIPLAVKLTLTLRPLFNLTQVCLDSWTMLRRFL